jgi:AraC-like DNA-binding protein
MQSLLNDKWVHWRSADYPHNQQFDAWCTALSESYLPWELSKPPSTQFNAEIDMRDIGDVRLLHCKTDPCHGWRKKHEINQGDDAYYGLLLVYDGQEMVKCKDNEICIDNKHSVLWDSTRPLEFKFYEKLKKVTLLVPQSKLKVHFPKIDQFVNQKINMSSGIGAIAASYIISLAKEATSIENNSGDSMVDFSLELMSICLEAKLARPMTKARSDLLLDVRNYIDNNLDNPDLGPSTIAAELYISNRYLHLLFEDEGTTVSNYILQKRLGKCRRELIRNGQYKRNITEIALQWGFNDASHFCRVFKKMFGLSPSEYRKSHFI